MAEIEIKITTPVRGSTELKISFNTSFIWTRVAMGTKFYTLNYFLH